MKSILMISIFMLVALQVHSQTLYTFLIVQNAPSVGTQQDKTTINHLLSTIDKQVRRLDIVTKIIDGVQATQSRMEQEISKLPITSDDVIWVYYTGHGINYDTWPMTDQNDLSLTWMDNRLRQTAARLTIAMFDCCNWDDPIVQPPRPPEYIQSGLNYYDYLFLHSKGHIKVASCASTQFAFGSQSSGSLFTNAFNDAIKGKASWRNVLNASKNITKEMAKNQNRQQHPIYELSRDFQDGTY